MLRFRALSALAVVVFLLAGCAGRGPAGDATPVRPAALSGPQSDQFGDYWYQGEAELTSYDLEQARYGEVHPGTAVLIYVTEPFSQSKQVKVDDPSEGGDDVVTVMKLNATRKFVTGIYPYSMMASVFTPVERQLLPLTLKVTATSQEWCGHTFTQVNRTDDGYRARLFSYFEGEGDQDLALPAARLEDDLWTTIRLNPDDLPTGRFPLIPGTLHQRLAHLPFQTYEAEATLEDGDDGTRVYTVRYPDQGRELAITFQAAFPHEIEGWTETFRSGFGPDAEVLTTRATRKQRMMLDYWNYNDRAATDLRAELGL